MGKLTVNLSLDNDRNPLPAPIKCRAVVDTGANCLTLPLAWRERFGAFARSQKVVAHTASHVVDGEMCGPVSVKIPGFNTVATEVLFIPMTPGANGKYEALLGHAPLELCGAIVDMRNLKLKPAMCVEVKSAGVRMGRIMASVTVENKYGPAPTPAVRMDALVYEINGLVLPRAWKEKFGVFAAEESREMNIAPCDDAKVTLCGPARVRVDNFNFAHTDVMFADIPPGDDGEYTPRLGRTILAMCKAMVDKTGTRLVEGFYEVRRAHARGKD